MVFSDKYQLRAEVAEFLDEPLNGSKRALLDIRESQVSRRV